MRTHWQVSWIGRSGQRVYSDIETRRDKAHMQAPTSAVGVEIHEWTGDETPRELVQHKIMHEPTPRAQR
jgi:hypothetical protein